MISYHYFLLYTQRERYFLRSKSKAMNSWIFGETSFLNPSKNMSQFILTSFAVIFFDISISLYSSKFRKVFVFPCFSHSGSMAMIGPDPWHCGARPLSSWDPGWWNNNPGREWQDNLRSAASTVEKGAPLAETVKWPCGTRDFEVAIHVINFEKLAAVADFSPFSLELSVQHHVDPSTTIGARLSRRAMLVHLRQQKALLFAGHRRALFELFWAPKKGEGYICMKSPWHFMTWQSIFLWLFVRLQLSRIGLAFQQQWSRSCTICRPRPQRWRHLRLHKRHQARAPRSRSAHPKSFEPWI